MTNVSTNVPSTIMWTCFVKLSLSIPQGKSCSSSADGVTKRGSRKIIDVTNLCIKWLAEAGVRDKLDKQDPAWGWTLHTIIYGDN